MLFNSRGFKAAASHKGSDLEAELVRASKGGKIPIVCDTSPCLQTIKGQLQDPSLKCDPLRMLLHWHLCEALPRHNAFPVFSALQPELSCAKFRAAAQHLMPITEACYARH